VLNGQYPSEADIAATQLGQSTVPIGEPRTIDAVPLPGATVDGAATARAEPSAPVVPSAPASAPAPDAAPLPVTGRAAGRDRLARSDE
jgi:penicillin-binding protein 2